MFTYQTLCSCTEYDGIRAIVRINRREVAIDSRNRRPLAATYPELANLPTVISGQALTLDGELVVLDAAGAPSFDLIQRRLRPHPPADVVARYPVIFVAFDLVHVNGRSLLNVPLAERRALLDALDIAHPHVQVPPVWSADRADQVLAVAHERGLEGVVAKRTGSRYQPGRRSRDWIKQPFWAQTTVVVGAWAPGEGRHRAVVGGLLVGAHDATGRLLYLGRLGTGLTDAFRRELAAALAQYEQPASPFADPVPRDDARGARWTAPILVAEVRYRSLTAERRLRHPNWLGTRLDVDPNDVTLPLLR